MSDAIGYLSGVMQSALSHPGTPQTVDYASTFQESQIYTLGFDQNLDPAEPTIWDVLPQPWPLIVAAEASHPQGVHEKCFGVI